MTLRLRVQGATAVANFTVTLIGNTRNRYCSEADWAHTFRQAGWNVLLLEERVATREALVQAGLQSDLLFFVLSRNRIEPEWVWELRDICPTVSWHADLYHGLERDGAWRQSAKWHCDLVLTADGNHNVEWAAMGVNHRWFLPGVRDTWVKTLGAKRRNFMCDVAFVGNNGSNYHKEWPYRQEMFNAVQSICRRRKWKFLNPGGLQRPIPFSGALNNFYVSASVTVGDSLAFYREKNLYWSNRVYEATGRRGLLIMPRIDALDEQYEGLLPCYEWGDWEHLEHVIETFLDDKEKRLQTVQNCYAVTRRDHTYSSRFQELLTVLEDENVLG